MTDRRYLQRMPACFKRFVNLELERRRLRREDATVRSETSLGGSLGD